MLVELRKANLGEDREDILEALGRCVETEEEESVGIVEGKVDGSPVGKVLRVTRQLQLTVFIASCVTFTITTQFPAFHLFITDTHM